jgi:hypothetical protein
VSGKGVNLYTAGKLQYIFFNHFIDPATDGVFRQRQGVSYEFVRFSTIFQMAEYGNISFVYVHRLLLGLGILLVWCVRFVDL